MASKTTKSKFSLFAFWHYDRFPFCLGAPIKRMKDDSFEPEGYSNYWFRLHPGVRLTPEETGRKLKEKLDLLENEYEKEQKALMARFQQKRLELFHEAGISPPVSFNQIEYQKKLAKEAKLDEELGFREKTA